VLGQPSGSARLLIGDGAVGHGHRLLLDLVSHQRDTDVQIDLNGDLSGILAGRAPRGGGSGGALALPLVRAAALIMNEMGTFSGQGVSKA